MKNTLIAGLGVLVVVLGGYIAVDWVGDQATAKDSEQRIEAHETEIAVLKERVEAISDQNDSELDAITEAAETAQASLLELQEEYAKLEAKLATAEEASIEEDAEDEVTTDDEEVRKASIEEIRQKLRDNAVAGAQIKALSEIIYADFINGLNLDADQKADLRALLSNSYLESLALNQYAIADGEIPWNEVTDWVNEERSILSDELKQLLSPEDFSTWSEYATTIDERQLEGSLRNQIRAFASGLTEENFNLVMQVAVQEFRAQQLALENSTIPFTQSENIHYQIRALAEMRARLTEMLSAEQYPEIENWITMAENIMESQLPKEPEAQ